MHYRHWILGGSDVEMSWIEKLLHKLGESVGFAYEVPQDGSNGNGRVSGGTAYASHTSYVGYDQFLPPADEQGRRPENYDLETIFVECASWLPGEPVPENSILLDHHRAGDPGHGKQPHEYLRASSAGQVCLKLMEYGKLPEMPLEVLSDFLEDTYSMDSLRYVAAADHCLRAAYQGMCPGVDTRTLAEYRVRSRAGFQNRPLMNVIRDIEETSQALCDHRKYVHSPAIERVRMVFGIEIDEYHRQQELGNNDYMYPEGHQCAWILDMRDTTYPELPEAACRTGHAYVSDVLEKSGRRKCVLGGAYPDVVRMFLRGEIIHDLIGHYGDPERGFAGGYYVE